MQRKTRWLAVTAGAAAAWALGASATEVRVMKVDPATGLGEVKIVRIAPAATGDAKAAKEGSTPDAMKAVRDKQTGKLRAPTAEEIDEIKQAAPGTRFVTNPVVVSRPESSVVSREDGTVTMRRTMEDLDSIVVTKSADGKLTVRHKQGHAPGDGHAHGHSTTAKPKE